MYGGHFVIRLFGRIPLTISGSSKDRLQLSGYDIVHRTRSLGIIQIINMSVTIAVRDDQLFSLRFQGFSIKLYS